MVATMVHLALGLLLVRSGVALYIANALAFCSAFVFGFTAHYRFTFAGTSVQTLRAFLRYFAVALAAFALNSLVLAIVGSVGLMPTEVAFTLAVGCASILSFVFSRLWAF